MMKNNDRKVPSGSGLALGIALGSIIGLLLLDNIAVGIAAGIAMGAGFESIQRNRNSDASS